jgi:hypothetical protein
VAVGVIQVAAAGLLLRPRSRSWFWFGIAGSAAVIAVWLVSRTLGLPFVEGGEPEPIGVADGLATLTEAWTIIVLGLYLVEPTLRSRSLAVGLAALTVLGLTGLWWLAADVGIFDTDPARLAADQPWLVDWLVAMGGFGMVTAVPLATRGLGPAPWQRGLLHGLVGAMAVTGLALVRLTLPPTIGQNVECRYAPLSTVLGTSHPEETEPGVLDAGEHLFMPAFELRACGSSAVTLERADPVTTVDHGATIGGVWLLPTGIFIPDEGAPVLPADAQPVPPGGQILPGQPRQLVVGIMATGEGDFSLASLRLTYRITDTDTDTDEFVFASQIAICSGACSEE